MTVKDALYLNIFYVKIISLPLKIGWSLERQFHLSESIFKRGGTKETWTSVTNSFPNKAIFLLLPIELTMMSIEQLFAIA